VIAVNERDRQYPNDFIEGQRVFKLEGEVENYYYQTGTNPLPGTRRVLDEIERSVRKAPSPQKK
jgi:hypothetical protein